MTPQKALRNRLSALLIFALMLPPLYSNEASADFKKRSFSVHLQVSQEGSADRRSNIDFSLPGLDKKERNQGKESNDKSAELTKGKHHSDEDKHKHHHFNYDRIKSRKRIHTTLVCVCIKILFGISYFSILLCTYLNICH